MKQPQWPPGQAPEKDVSPEPIKEKMFEQLVASKLLDEFSDELYEAGLSSLHIEEVAIAFSSLSEEDKKHVLSLPAQLRPKLFEKYVSQIETGALSAEDVITDLLKKTKEGQYTIGYHLSQNDIKRGKDGSWVVVGTEPDHRHNDVGMAYYSKSYMDRYMRKPSRYLYIVRVATAPDSGHHQDNGGSSWGHAPKLDVIAKIDLLEIENELENRVKSFKEAA